MCRTLLIAAAALACVAHARTIGLEQEEKMLSSRLNLAEFHAMMEEVDQALVEQEQQFSEEIEQLKKHIVPRNLTQYLDDGISEINIKTQVEKDLYEGDIALAEWQLSELDVPLPANSTRRRRQAWTPQGYFPRNIWGETPIAFTLDNSLTASGKQAILDAVKFWQTNTCLNFVQRAGNDNGISFFRGEGCWSYVGKQGTTRQQLSIGNGCDSMGTAAHEIQHAIGTWHVQSRYDRDNYVYVDMSNIEQKQQHNFNKESQASTNNYNIPYEYGSNMHYDPYGFAKDRTKPTMLARQQEYQDSQGSYQPTFYDVLLVNEFYSCNKKCPTNRCANGGYPNPRNCGVCVCPQGWGGSYCQDLPTGCVKQIRVTAQAQDVSIQVGDRNVRTTYDKCTYILTADAGKRIEMTMKSLSGVTSGGCSWGGIEVIKNKDTRLAGLKFCLGEHARKQVVSESNRAVIVAYNRAYGTNVVLSARAY